MAQVALLNAFFPTNFDKERFIAKCILNTKSHLPTAVEKHYSFLSSSFRSIPETIYRPFFSSNKKTLHFQQEAQYTHAQQFLCIFGHMSIQLYAHPNEGLPLTLGPDFNNKDACCFKIGQVVDVASRTNHLDSREGTIISINRNDDDLSFNIKLSTEVLIILREHHGREIGRAS